MAPDPLIGTVIAGHQIEAVIGRGGMGSVYLARHLRLGKARALKLLPPDLAEDEDFRGRFEREWRVAAEIEHPSIVEVLDAGEQDGRLYILMRYVDGVDLHKVIDTQGPLELERAVNVLAQVASALDSAHSRGLIHRDVKPSNILLGPDDRAFLSDFGIAKSRSTRGLTKTGLFVGTVDYASPEQIESRPLDGRADVYALGGVLYSCVTGAPPYERDTDIQVIFAQLRDPVPKPSSKRLGLPARLDDVLGRAMAKAKEERYGTCGEFLGDAQSVVADVRRGADTRLDLRGATELDLPGATELDLRGGTELDRSDATQLDRSDATQLDRSDATQLDRSGGTVLDEGGAGREAVADLGSGTGDGGRIRPLPGPGDGGRRPLPRRLLLGALAAVVLLVVASVGAVALLGGGGDTVDVAGRVLDTRSSQPVEGVRIAAGSGSSLTSSDGRFSFNAVPRDAAIDFTSCAYAPRQMAVADVDGELTMRLDPLPVRGTVKSGLTGQGLAGTVRDGDRSARTARDGSFRLYGSCPGGSLEVSAPGFIKTSVDVAPNRTAAAVLSAPTTVRETFSNVRNWFAGAGGAVGGSAQGWNAFVAGGAYHVRVTKRNWNAGATSADFDPATRFRTIPRSTVLPADVRFTVDARKVMGADASTGTGVACHTAAAGGLSYEFVVSNDGYYRLDRRVGPKHTELVPWRKSSHIRAGTRNNRLTVECRGGPPVRLRLVANGHTLIAAKDTPRLKGFQSIYLYATAYETAPIEVAFDNVVFTRRQ